MNKISFIIEFDEVSKTQEEQLAEFIEKTGIKFHVLESDNDLNKYKKYKEVIDKATNELFILKDMIYKPETREENFEIQRKISSIIKRLNGKEVE